MSALKLMQIGNSVGVILPKDLPARLKLEKGDTLFWTEAANGVNLSAYSPEFEIQMTEARRIMMARPDQLAHYGALDAADLAASYGYSISRYHPFVNGNNRTAFVAVELFLALNGFELTATDADCAVNMLNLAAGKLPEAAFAQWIRQNLKSQAA